MTRRSIKPLLLTLTLLITSAGAVAYAQDHAGSHATGNVRENVTPELRREVLQALENWKRAVIRKDRAKLELAYHDDLTYGHTDGEVLSKSEQIERTLVPERSFPAIDISDVAVRVYGDVALVTAKFAFHVARGGSLSISELSGVDVWIKGEDGWQLVARQLTRPKK